MNFLIFTAESFIVLPSCFFFCVQISVVLVLSYNYRCLGYSKIIILKDIKIFSLIPTHQGSILAFVYSLKRNKQKNTNSSYTCIKHLYKTYKKYYKNTQIDEMYILFHEEQYIKNGPKNDKKSYLTYFLVFILKAKQTITSFTGW